jgi:hypothetical protein
VYSWRVPLTIGDADLTLAFSQDLGDLGGGTAKPVVIPWSWSYHVPGLVLFWGLLLVPLLATKEYRRRSVWAILLLLAPALVILGTMLEILQPVSRTVGQFSDFRFIYLFCFAMVMIRPLQRWFSERLVTLARLSGLLIVAALALAFCASSRGIWGGVEALLLFAFCTLSLFLVILPSVLFVRSCHQPPWPKLVAWWPCLWTLLTAATVALVIVAW